MNKWNLNVLYTSYEDPQFKKDIEMYQTIINENQQYAATLSQQKDTQSTLIDILKSWEKEQSYAEKLFSYVQLRESCDTSDPQTANYQNQLLKIANCGTTASATFQRFISNCNDLDQYVNKSDFLKKYAFILKELQTNGKHLLSNEGEEIVAKLNNSGGHAWQSLHSYLTSMLNIDFEGEQLSLPQIRNKAYDEDQKVRKAAYLSEQKAYEKIADSIAFSLNNIKAQVISECELRKHKDPLSLTLHNARMSEETLTALLSGIQEYLPLFQQYLKHKAKLLNHRNGLPWYDLFAPIQKSKSIKKYSVQEAKTYLLSHFKNFSNDMYEMIEQAFDEDWIDFFPRMKKVGGAFCNNLPFLKQSRILTNFDGSQDGLLTLAHELGHAYHGMMIENNAPLNRDYCMPLAESASTFNEFYILKKSIAESDDDHKIILIEKQLQDITQLICDIYSRYLFESEVFKRRKKEFLFTKDLNEIMLSAQKDAYQDGLDPSCLHPYMWVNKPHYYSPSLSFYNFPYAFGGLFARGLLLQYEKDPKQFVPNYQKMLKATCTDTVEDVAKIVNINVCEPAFWKESLASYKPLVETFLAYPTLK